MADIDNSLKDLPNLLDELSVVRKETIKHSQLATARENLKHIFMVPETVRQTEAWIEEGKLLDAHKVGCSLENKNKKKQSYPKLIIVGKKPKKTTLFSFFTAHILVSQNTLRVLLIFCLNFSLTCFFLSPGHI